MIDLQSNIRDELMAKGIMQPSLDEQVIEVSYKRIIEELSNCQDEVKKSKDSGIKVWLTNHGIGIPAEKLLKDQ